MTTHDIDPQPTPTKTTGRPVWDAVIEDMQARDTLGRARYGTPLQAKEVIDGPIAQV